MARHKYNDFDNALLRQRIDVPADFPHKKELVNYLEERGYFNQTIAERIAYVFLANNNQPMYNEIAIQMSAIIALQLYHSNELFVKNISGDDIPLGKGSTQLFIRCLKEHILSYLKRKPCDNNNVIMEPVGMALEDTIQQYKVNYYPWRGEEGFSIGPYDEELYLLCSKVFDGDYSERKDLQLIQNLIGTFCELSAKDSCLFRMIEEYDSRYTYILGESIAKKRHRTAYSSNETRQIQRLKNGLFPNKTKTVSKIMKHLSYQYIYYVLTENVLAPNGYVPHKIAAMVYDLYRIVCGEEIHTTLSDKEKHANIIRAFKIEQSTGLYSIGI